MAWRERDSKAGKRKEREREGEREREREQGRYERKNMNEKRGGRRIKEARGKKDTGG